MRYLVKACYVNHWMLMDYDLSSSMRLIYSVDKLWTTRSIIVTDMKQFHNHSLMLKSQGHYYYIEKSGIDFEEWKIFV
jgi:hypothetical protein